MDAAEVVQVLTMAACLYVIARITVRPLDKAEAVFASLFVPPDRALGWPRGVQESDEPWGWQPPIDPLADDRLEPDAGALAELAVAPTTVVLSGHATYVEAPHRVDPVHVRTLPQ